MIDVFTQDALTAAIDRSRALIPVAVDALCDVITEVTGRVPDRSRVEYVSMHWLMHACDIYVYDSGEPRNPRKREVDIFTTGAPTRRSKMLAMVGSKRASIVVTEAYLKCGIKDEIRAVARSRRWLRWSASPTTGIVVAQPDFARRQSAARGSVGARGSRDDLRATIALTAPVELVELHHHLASWAKAGVNPDLRLAFTANAQQSSVAFRYWLFEQRQLGTRIAIQQHGGSYGIDERHLGEDLDIWSGDVFYTWGWERPDLGPRVRPLPTATPRRAKRADRASYLLISIHVTSHFYRLQSFLIPSQIEKAIDETAAFASGLSTAVPLVMRSSAVHPFPMHRLGQHHVEISLDDQTQPGPFAASRHALVIHNYLGTSWLETLAMDIPTVCFYDPRTYRPRDAARPFIDALARVGVVHHSGADAAAFVNRLNGNPRGWWKSPEVQAAREAFVAHYANFSDNWLDAWQEEFERLLAE